LYLTIIVSENIGCGGGRAFDGFWGIEARTRARDPDRRFIEPEQSPEPQGALA
jgi:hypothetical protein